MRTKLFVVSSLVVSALIAGTLVANAASVTVAAAGDIARADKPGTPQQQTAAIITDVIKPANVLVLGDEQYEHGEYSQFLASYDPTWGAFKNISLPVPGNHEYETPGATGYFQYFGDTLTPYGASATDPTKGYYSTNIGDWHIVALNSNCGSVNCSAEKTWLKQDLAADTHLCELAFYHHSSNKGFAKKMSLAGGDLVLTAHRHTYERWDDVFGFVGLRRLVVGTGGKSLAAPDPAATFGANSYGVMELTLNAASYSWAFHSVSGSVLDSGTTDCGPTP
jgi:acid phosphatase type 7